MDESSYIKRVEEVVWKISIHYWWTRDIHEYWGRNQFELYE
jgi:hypothetical protein